jgi:sulfur carrier protein ThiS
VAKVVTLEFDPLRKGCLWVGIDSAKNKNIQKEKEAQMSAPLITYAKDGVESRTLVPAGTTVNTFLSSLLGIEPSNVNVTVNGSPVDGNHVLDDADYVSISKLRAGSGLWLHL